MEITGLVLGVVAEARHQIISIKDRIEKIRDGPDTFQSLTADLSKLMGQIDTLDIYLRSTPATAPTPIRALFQARVESVRDILKSCSATFSKDCSKAFPGGSSSKAAKFQSRILRATRATALKKAMEAIHLQVQSASGIMGDLISPLVTEENIQVCRDVLASNIGDLRTVTEENTHDVLTKLSDIRSDCIVKEVYRVGPSTPAPPQATTLNFSVKNADGMHATPEGRLKESILSLKSTSAVTVATGVVTPGAGTRALGLLGMAGVGKTVALQGLAFDEDILRRFPGGILYIALGQGATLATAIGQVAKIMRQTGALGSVADVQRARLLGEAVDYAVMWFHQKTCLFLVDDLWPTKNCPTGFLYDIRQLLRSCPKSRMAITTRSTFIAQRAGVPVDFAPREALGAMSKSIFMMHATGDVTKKAPHELTGDLRRSVAKILTICGGLPIALAVTGCAVASLEREHGDFERACDDYALQLQKQRIALSEMQVSGGSSLNAGIYISLKILEAEYVQLKEVHGHVTDYSISDMYTSLCVLGNQAFVPVSVLSGMWNASKDFALGVVRLLSGLSLCTVDFRQLAYEAAKDSGIKLHDLQLDFCKLQAERRKTSSLWHTRLLNGYLSPVSSTSSLSADRADSFEQLLLSYAPRAWWSVPDDGYIHTNLARHLLSANLVMELAALLLDARWTHVRFKIGGVMALKSDFKCVSTLGGETSQSFELIRKSVQLSWGRVPEGRQSFLFHVCGRLVNLRAENVIVDSYLRSVEKNTSVPYLMPLNSFFPDPRSAQILEIPVGSTCRALACSPCGQYIAAGGDNDVVVAKVSTGVHLKRLKGHTGLVSCVSFALGSSKIVSGSLDKSVSVWSWETSEYPVYIFKGHRDWVNGVVCTNNGKIFSCSRDCTLRRWDANTPEQTEKFVQHCSVESVAISSDDRFVAIGLEDGTLKVVDSWTGKYRFEDAAAHGERVTSITFSANGERFATGSTDRTIRIWDAARWRSIGEPIQVHFVYCITFSPDAQKIAFGSGDGFVRLWDSNSRSCIWASSTVHSTVGGVVFAHERGRIISGSSEGIIRIWDTGFRAEPTDGEGESSVSDMAISPDGRRVAAGFKDGTIRLLDSHTGSQIGRPLEGHKDDVVFVSCGRDGRHLLSYSLDSSIRLWDTNTFNQVESPVLGPNVAGSFSLSSDGCRISAVSTGGMIIYDAKAGRLIERLHGFGSIVAVAESCDGLYVVCKNIIGKVTIWIRATEKIVWRSTSEDGAVAMNEMTRDEAERIIRSCGQETPHLWPNSFPRFNAEVYFRNKCVYSNVPADDTLVGTLPSEVQSWKYNEAGKVFVAKLRNGTYALCRLIV